MSTRIHKVDDRSIIRGADESRRGGRGSGGGDAPVRLGGSVETPLSSFP